MNGAGTSQTRVLNGRGVPADSLVVAEVFGPTFQGEGPNVGQRVGFVRLGGCNLTCTWCDTPYTWDGTRYDLRAELTRQPVAQVVAQVRAMNVSRVVVTGGEPLLWQHKLGWDHLLAAFVNDGVAVEVETNGTITPDRRTITAVDHFNVSPKLAHSGDSLHRRIVPKALAEFGRLAQRFQASLKVVVLTADDVRCASELGRTFGWPAPTVWVLPEGTDAPTLLYRHQQLAQAALDYGVNMTTRLHVLTWGEERGR